MLINKSLNDYINQAASGDPTPGGGSVSALVGSLGSALTNMVANLTFDKKAYKELFKDIQKEMKNNFNQLEQKIKTIKEIVDEDAKAFDGVLEAFKLPKDTEKEKSIRNRAIQEGYKRALEVPLRCAEECYEVLQLQEVFAYYGNRNAITDIGVGALLAYSGLEGSLLNVRINLLSIKDIEYKEEIKLKMNELLDDGEKQKDKVMEIVYGRLE